MTSPLSLCRPQRFIPFSLCLLSLAACLSSIPSPSPSPFLPVSPSLPPSPSSSPPPPVSPSPSPFPPPRLTPTAVLATIAAGEERLEGRGIQPLCLRLEETDDDGELEWVGLYWTPTEPPQVHGFVLDGSGWYDLAPPESEESRGLGEYPSCELEIRDLNGDGRHEVAIWGHIGIGTDLLHIFAWDGNHYALLGAFRGDGGVRIEDTDRDLVEEVVVRLEPEGDLVREIVYTWDGSHYAWTWDRYAWFYRHRPHPYVTDTPLHALASFYLALNDRDLPGAYGLLSSTAQTVRPYDEWALGFSTTLRVEVGATRVVSQEGGQATVAAQVRALDNVYGRVIATLYDVEWLLVQTERGWRLENGSSQVLEQWEMEYYP